MTKEELIENIGNRTIVEGSQKVLDKLIEMGVLNYTGRELDDKISSFNGNFCLYKPEAGFRFYHISDGVGKFDLSEEQFLSWFKEEKKPPKKKRGPKPKLNKREKLEARLSQVEETTKSAFDFDIDGESVCKYKDDYYSMECSLSPEEALQFAKWILDLEGK